MKRMRSKLVEAKADLDRAVQLYRNTNDCLRVASCLRGLGDIAREQYDFSAARQYYEEALEKYTKGRSAVETLARPLSDLGSEKSIQEMLTRGEADCIFRLGILAQDECLEHEKAAVLYEKALKLHKSVGDLIGQAHCLKRLGDVEMARDQRINAEKKYQEASALYEHVPYVAGMADCTHI